MPTRSASGLNAPSSRPGVLTSVQEVEAPSVEVAPNPASDRITVRTPEAYGTIEVVDLEGRRHTMVVVRTGATEVNVSGMASGTYIVRYRVGRDVRETKLQVR